MYTGNKVRLRALEMDDLPIILKYFNNMEVRRYLASDLPYSQLAEKNWLEKACQSDPTKDHELHLAIEEKTTKEFLGSISLMNINVINLRAEMGIAIHNPKNFGKGYGTDALRLILWVAFNILNLHSVYLRVVDFNERGQRCYAKCGFKNAGELRHAAFTEGKYHNMLFMDILQEEFFHDSPPGTFYGKSIFEK